MRLPPGSRASSTTRWRPATRRCTSSSRALARSRSTASGRRSRRRLPPRRRGRDAARRRRRRRPDVHRRRRKAEAGVRRPRVSVTARHRAPPRSGRRAAGLRGGGARVLRRAARAAGDREAAAARRARRLLVRSGGSELHVGVEEPFRPARRRIRRWLSARATRSTHSRAALRSGCRGHLGGRCRDPGPAPLPRRRPVGQPARARRRSLSAGPQPHSDRDLPRRRLPVAIPDVTSGLHDRGEDLGVLTFRWRPVGVDDEIRIAVIRRLKRSAAARRG